MRVILWGINYAPEPTGIGPFTTGLAEHLAAQGMAVTVVTGFSYYPGWTQAAGDRGQGFRTEQAAGVTVERCWLYVPRTLTTLRRMLHELSFVASSLLRILTLGRPDLYVVVSPPLGLGLAARVAARLKGTRYLLHVQDLQPDSAAGLGMMRPGAFLRLLYGCERWAYRGAAGVAGISAGMTAAFKAKGVPAGKILLLPNWSRPASGPEATREDAAAFRGRHQIPARALLAVYAGNLGRKQGLGVLIDAASALSAEPRTGRPVVILIAGDGAGREGLEARLGEQPSPRIRLLPLQAAADYAAMLRAADVALVTQMPGTGQVCFPSKLLTCLAAGLPVITVADASSDLARAVAEGGFGCNVCAGDGTGLAQVLHRAANEQDVLAQWKLGTRWVERFAPEKMLARFESAVRSLAAVDAAQPRPAVTTGVN